MGNTNKKKKKCPPYDMQVVMSRLTSFLFIRMYF
jgi:hypothetical protein